MPQGERILQAKASRLTALAKYRARKKSLDFTIDKEWTLEQLQKGTCTFSGLPFSYDPHPTHRVNPWSPSIHRRDSNQGYTKENATLVCAGVNTAINCMDTQSFLLLSMAVLRKHNLN